MPWLMLPVRSVCCGSKVANEAPDASAGSLREQVIDVGLERLRTRVSKKPRKQCRICIGTCVQKWLDLKHFSNCQN